MITEKTLKEESTNKNHYADNYSAPFACRSFAFDLLTVFVAVARTRWSAAGSTFKRMGGWFLPRLVVHRNPFGGVATHHIGVVPRSDQQGTQNIGKTKGITYLLTQYETW